MRIKFNAPDNALTISSRGNVGMGTTNPYAKLTVDSYTDSQIQRLRNKQGYFDIDVTKSIDLDSGKDKAVIYSTDTNKFQYTKPISINKVVLESKEKNGAVGIDFKPNHNSKKLGAVQISSSHNKTGNSEGAYLYLGRRDINTGKDLKHVSYDVDGNIGIGTTNPDAKLHIVTDTNSSTDNGVKFKAGGPNNSHSAWGPSNDWYIRSGHSNGKVILQDTGGNVGIGTSAPAAKLHNVGSMRNDGTSTLNGNLTVNGNTSLKGSLGVSGSSNFDGSITGNDFTFKNNGADWRHRSGGDAAIVNSKNYDTLMIVGRGDGTRRIGMWDDVTVHKNLNINGKTCMNGVCIEGGDIQELVGAVKGLASQMDSFEKVKGGPPKYQKISDNGWGSSKSAKCPSGHYQCGTWIRHEGKQGGGDDTGVNGLGIYCCSFY